MEGGTPSSYLWNSRFRDDYPITPQRARTNELRRSQNLRSVSPIDRYTQSQQRVTSRGQALQPPTCLTYYNVGAKKDRTSDPKDIQHRNQQEVYERTYMCRNTLRNTNHQQISRNTLYSSKGTRPHFQHFNNQHDTRRGALEDTTNLSPRRSQNSPRLASPISWNIGKGDKTTPVLRNTTKPKHVENQQFITPKNHLRGLVDEAGSPISMSEYMLNKINSQQNSPHSLPQVTPLEDRIYHSSRPRTTKSQNSPVPNYRNSHGHELYGSRVYLPPERNEPSDSTTTLEFDRGCPSPSGSEFNISNKKSPQAPVPAPDNSPSHPSTPIQSVPANSTEPKFTFMDKWLRKPRMRDTYESDVKPRSSTNALPETGIIFQERKPVSVVEKKKPYREYNHDEESPVNSKISNTASNWTESGTIRSPICLDTPCSTPAKSTPMRSRLPTLPKSRPQKSSRSKVVKTVESALEAEEVNFELTRQIKAARSITKREFDIDQEDLQRAIFGEVLDSEDEDERKEKELQAKRELRLREKERRETEALRAIEEKTRKELEARDLAKQLAEERRLQKEREERAKRVKREQARKKKAAEEEAITEQRRQAAADRILKSRAKEVADKEAKEIERKRLTAVQSEKDAREELERKKFLAKEQATSIRQYSLNRGDHVASLERQQPVDNPLFMTIDSGTPRGSSAKNATETFAEAGKAWRGRSKLQEEREAFEQDIALKRMQSARNKMAAIFPKKAEPGDTSKKRVASKANNAPRKKPRTALQGTSKEKGEDGDDEQLLPVQVNNSPYSGRVPKIKPKSRPKRPAGSQILSKSSLEPLRIDDEVAKATIINRKMQAAMLSGQALTTELYQQFQRESSVELAQIVLHVEGPAKPIKEKLQAPPKQKRPGTKKPRKSKTVHGVFGTVIPAPEPPSLQPELLTGPILQDEPTIPSNPQPAIPERSSKDPLLASQAQPKLRSKLNKSPTLQNTVKETFLTPEEAAQKEEEDKIAAACLRLEQDRADILTFNFGYNESRSVEDDSDESNEDEEDALRKERPSTQKPKQDVEELNQDPVNNGTDISVATDLLLLSEQIGTQLETQALEDDDHELERALEEELLKELGNGEETVKTHSQQPSVSAKSNPVIRVYRVLMIKASPEPAKAMDASEDTSLSEFEEAGEPRKPTTDTKVLKEFLSYTQANSHAQRSFNTQKRKTVTRLSYSESSPGGFFHGEIKYKEGQSTQIKIETATLLSSNFPGYHESKMEYRFTPVIYFVIFVLVMERVDEDGQKMRESIEQNVGKHCTDRQMMNNSAAEEFIQFLKPDIETRDNIIHHEELRKAVRDQRDVVNGDGDSLLEMHLSIDDECVPWMKDRGYVAISVVVRKSELYGPLN